MNIYSGKSPKDVNPTWPDHTADYIVCLLVGKQKKKIEKGYLAKFGYTKEQYQTEFDNAPLVSISTKANYSKAANSDKGKKQRSENLKRLNSDTKFQELRVNGCIEYWKNETNNVRRIYQANLAKKQHQNGLTDHIRKVFWEDKYQKDDHWKIIKSDSAKRTNEKYSDANRKRMTESNPAKRDDVKEKMRISAQQIVNNPILLQQRLNKRQKTIETNLQDNQNYYKKSKESQKLTIANNYNYRTNLKQYKDTNLMYDSSYEQHFLDYIFDSKHLPYECITNARFFREKGTCFVYIPDFLLFNKLIVEIKSSYIYNLQETKNPGINERKKLLVIKNQYDYILVMDKDYDQLTQKLNFYLKFF